MKVVVILEDDLLRFLQEDVERTGASIDDVLSAALRMGLLARRSSATAPFKVEPFATSGFAPAVDERKLGQLADSLDTEQFLHDHT